jgi:hypothetical protein
MDHGGIAMRCHWLGKVTGCEGIAVFITVPLAIKRSFEGRNSGLIHQVRQYLLQIRPGNLERISAKKVLA